MKCWHCGKHGSKVIDSRYAEGVRRRRHQCTTCGGRYSTAEIAIAEHCTSGQFEGVSKTWNSLVAAVLPRIATRTMLHEIEARVCADTNKR